MNRKVHNTLTIILASLLALGWLAPFLIILFGSFKTRSEIFNNPIGWPSQLMLDNYRTAWEEMDFGNSFMHSLVITVVSVFLIVLISAMAAYGLSRLPSKFSKFVYYLCAVLMLVPFQTVMIPLVTMFGSFNLLSQTGLIIMNIGFGLSMSIFLFYGALQSVPASLDEAAMLDGASPFRAFWQIIFPSLRSTTSTVVILNAIHIWNDYLLPSLVINSEGNRTIPLTMYNFFGEYTVQWELALAGLVLSILPIIILYIFLQRHIIQGVTDGAVKQ